MIGAKLKELRDKFYCRGGMAKYQLDSKGWLLLLVIIIGTAGLVYLSQVNSLATKGYKIKELENKAADLRDQNKQYELQITELRSTARINEAIKKLEMVEVARVEYLRPNGTTVAINR